MQVSRVIKSRKIPDTHAQPVNAGLACFVIKTKFGTFIGASHVNGHGRD
jgi:hypothetical protein